MSGVQAEGDPAEGVGRGCCPPAALARLTAACALLQVFPLSPGPRWQSSSARPVALALQQALGQELARVRQGSPEVTGIAVRLLQAIATLLNSPHSGALVMSMHRHHFLACPLMRQLCQYQVGVSADPRERGASCSRAPSPGVATRGRGCSACSGTWGSALCGGGLSPHPSPA